MNRCLEPKSDADVHSLLCGDDLNPVQCRLRPTLLGGFYGKSDRFLIITFIIRLVFAHDAGGEGFAFVPFQIEEYIYVHVSIIFPVVYLPTA